MVKSGQGPGAACPRDLVPRPQHWVSLLEPLPGIDGDLIYPGYRRIHSILQTLRPGQVCHLPKGAQAENGRTRI